MNPILLKIIFFLSGGLIFFLGYMIGKIRRAKKEMSEILEMFNGIPKIMEKKEELGIEKEKTNKKLGIKKRK